MKVIIGLSNMTTEKITLIVDEGVVTAYCDFGNLSFSECIYRDGTYRFEDAPYTMNIFEFENSLMDINPGKAGHRVYLVVWSNEKKSAYSYILQMSHDEFLNLLK